MSFKTLFDNASTVTSLANQSAEDIASQVESVGYHVEDIRNEKRVIPNVDFSKPANFARYGSAEEYYLQSIERVYETYPYDGSLKERLEWEQQSLYIDLYLLENQYPRTNGYVIMSAEGWGLSAGSVDGYGSPTTPEYIYFEGGPHPNPAGMSPFATQFSGSNVYEPSMNRESNLQLDIASRGASVEFWLKKDEFITGLTEKEVIFDAWNGELSSSADYGRLRVEISGTADGLNPVYVTLYSGSTGFTDRVASPTFTTSSLADGNWHHYAVTLLAQSSSVLTRFYVDGQLNHQQSAPHTMGDINSQNLRAHIGALITSPSGSGAPANAGKLSGSLDEFRYWKTHRSSEDVGKYWISQVGGGTNTDPLPFLDSLEAVNTHLGVYYKFNEGITGRTSTDSVVLDYSGRVSNGSWEGYTTTSRNTGSAIVLSNAAIKEFKDPIIYSFHPKVVALKAELQQSGSAYDAGNNASIYNSIPAWITEEDTQGQFQTRYLTQIMGSYFDTLQIQMDTLSSLKNIKYVKSTEKPFPYSEKFLSSQGLLAPDLFIDADVLEKLADRSEDKIYEKSLSEIKNIIYQNIYNNLSYIYKSKGTEKSFRNLIRCFGIDDELIKLQLYAKNTTYEYRDTRRTVLITDKQVNFNTEKNKSAVVYSFSSSANPNSTGIIPASTELTGGYALTLEADIRFPTKPKQRDRVYYFTNAISSSLFGVHGALGDQTDTAWPASDDVNFQVYAIRDELLSDNVRFLLTGTAGTHIPEITSSLYHDVYTDTSWNLAVRIKPEKFPLSGLVAGAPADKYIIELHGVQTRAGEVINIFNESQTITNPPAGFMTGSRRVFLGAHRQDITGALLHTSDVRIDAARFWLDYVDDEALRQHALDSENHGAFRPSLYAFPWDSDASYGEVSKVDTLAFNWEFSENTGSNAAGQLNIADESSGSADLAATRFGWIGEIVNQQVTARGSFFEGSSKSAIKKDFLVASRLNDLEVIAPAETVEVLSVENQQEFRIDSRPINYYFAFEKSMSKVISEEMVNSFGTLKDFNNLIGDAVNRYRGEYKTLAFMRKKFFEKVGNSEIDFDKFYEFYKWFDSALSFILLQLVPAGADFAQNIRTVIESTTLERSKYQSKFPFIDQLNNVFSASLQSNVDYGDAISSPDDDPQGTGLYPAHAPTRRAAGLSERAAIKKWKYVHAPVTGEQKEKYIWWKNKAERNAPALNLPDALVNNARSAINKAVKREFERAILRPYRYSVTGNRVLGGVGQNFNKRVNFVFEATQPYGEVVPSTNIPKNIMLSFDTDVETLLDTTDEFYPTYKQRLGFGLNPNINRDEDITLKLNGGILAPFSLYEASPVSEYDRLIEERYHSGTTITNLHHDFVDSTDISMQGPFTEKFVGGRYYRHTELNPGSDTRETRAEGYRIELGLLTASVGVSGALGIVPPNYPFGDSPSGSAPLGWLADVPTAQRFRDETAKRPVNVKNILMTTASIGTRINGVLHHNSIGNYEKNYQVVNTSGRTQNDLYFREQTFNFSQFPETTATRGRFPLTASTANVGGNRDYELPQRTGSNSNQTVIVNRFSSPGSYEVRSRGYMDPAHEELSVYNALPYRNRGVISYGLSGSASVDPVAAHTITVVDQIGKNRGLNQRASLHCGPFGSDAAYGSVPTLTYVTVPSWQKTNRNARKLMKSGSAPSTFVTGVVYDNLFVQHQIPRSEQQYLWITASLAEGETIFGLQGPSYFSTPALTQIMSSSTGQDNDGNPIVLNFVGINEYVYEPLSASSHILGYPLGTDLLDYRNTTFLPAGIANTFNVLQLHRNGPYGYPMWKQSRTGEHPIARELRENNIIGTMLPPPMVPVIESRRLVQWVKSPRSTQFVDYNEQPVSTRYVPTRVLLEDETDDSNTVNNVELKVSYGSMFDYFSNTGLNNRLATPYPDLENNSLKTVFDYVIDSDLTVQVDYAERIYPAQLNAYRNIVRSRTEFTIDDIWNDSRQSRSDLGSEKQNSQGVEVLSASVWPLDGHLNFTTTSSVTSQDGSGELMNSYSRYLLPVLGGGTGRIFPAATYASRIACGTTGSGAEVVFAGDTEWLAASQAGKQPHQEYVDYAHRIRLVGKDHSIVPEFRISSHMETYIDDTEGDFLAEIDTIFELTGATYANSSDSNFYKVYTNSDFMKYFKTIDEDLNDKRSGDLKIHRENVSLKCDALIKFLPYKGFYPASYTTELATIFSQSYAPFAGRKAIDAAARTSVYRALLEPLYSPGIMYNTVKSGIAVSNFVMTNTASAGLATPIPSTSSSPTLLPEGTIDYKGIIKLGLNLDFDSGYYLQKIPFEALYAPSTYFGNDFLTGSGLIFDTGVSTGAVVDTIDSGGPAPASVNFINGKRLYEFAIDNFLCETLNFFNDKVVNFESKREDQFAPVVSGTTYTMQFKMYRSMNNSGSTDREAFDMYRRISAFGAPITQAPYGVGTTDSASFSHITPPYFSGSGTATFTFTAPATEVPSLDTILANTTIEFNRDEVVPAPTTGDYDVRMHVDSCFNLTDYYNSVPRSTVGSKKTWLIQSKFETPVLNFAHATSSFPPPSTVAGALTPASEILTTGMWHQYGRLPNRSEKGIYAVIDEGDQQGGQDESLAEVVGFPTGRPLRIGAVKKENLLEEAVVAVPFKVTRNRRKFFKARQRNTKNGTNAQFLRLKPLLEKYVFPPKFDFMRHHTVDPILMYVFEFSAKITQQDIADMWQNLPPDIGEKFEQKQVKIEEKEILDLLATNSEDIQWMVFKVKKRAKKNFEKYRRSLVTKDTSAFPDTIGEYSYNWPYDYFSLVELIKIEEGVKYSSVNTSRAAPVTSVPTTEVPDAEDASPERSG